MADPELEAIRQQRLAQLQSQYKGGDGENQQAAAERQRQVEDMRNSILTQVLDQSARARCKQAAMNTLSLGKPEKAKMVEEMLVSMAKQGRLPGKLGEKELINLLESVNQQTRKTTTVKFDRRRAALDSDDD